MAALDHLFPVPFSLLIQRGGGMGGLSRDGGFLEMGPGAEEESFVVNDPEPIGENIKIKGFLGIHDLTKNLYPILSVESSMSTKGQLTGQDAQMVQSIGVTNPGSIGIGTLLGLTNAEVESLTPVGGG
jgi:hypothetical protein